MKHISAAVTGLVVVIGSAGLVARADLSGAVRAACDNRNFALAEREIQSFRSSVGATPEVIESLSWLARGEMDAGQLDPADRHATETRQLCLDILKRGGPAPAQVGLALGAAIEVHAQVLAARGQRTEAITFLKTELTAWRQTPIASRIQKNINLLTLVGKPAPALDLGHWLGKKQPPSLAALQGHPVLLFFWAHWCGDCKAEVPILARLMQTYGPRGLLLVAPTQLYGFTAAGDATPESETRYIEEVRKQFYAPLAGMPVPLSVANFDKYGCSTTPTLVLLDANGIVRLYHPGAMTYDALAARVKLVTTPRPSNRNSG
jgi:thiol-disulfide isomerase/thioredoxin